MHVYTHLSEKYLGKITPQNNWTISEAGMAEFDDVVGNVLAKLDQLGIADNTIVMVTTDNGAETLSWPDGGVTPFAGQKGMSLEGGFRSPAVMRWPGKIKPGTVNNEIVSGLDWFPTFVAAAGGSQDIAADLVKGATVNGKPYKVHLDGYNQLDLLTGQGASKRHEVWYFAEANIGAARIDDYKYRFIDQPDGWFGPKVTVNWPILTNLRADPFERGNNFGDTPFAASDFFGHEFWRYTFVQKEVGKLAQTFIEFPTQQDPASFNLDQVKAHIKAMQEKLKAAGPGQ
jgi:arylsulfatase